MIKRLQGHKKMIQKKLIMKDDFKNPYIQIHLNIREDGGSTHNLSNRDQRDNINQSRKHISKKS